MKIIPQFSSYEKKLSFEMFRRDDLLCLVLHENTQKSKYCSQYNIRQKTEKRNKRIFNSIIIDFY